MCALVVDAGQLAGPAAAHDLLVQLERQHLAVLFGDVISEVDGEPINSEQQLRYIVESWNGYSPLYLVYIRDGVEFDSYI
jgi:S1-C subfamily serine protease